LRPTVTIRLDSKLQIIAQLFDLIQNEKNTIRTAVISFLSLLTHSPSLRFVLLDNARIYKSQL